MISTINNKLNILPSNRYLNVQNTGTDLNTGFDNKVSVNCNNFYSCKFA